MRDAEKRGLLCLSQDVVIKRPSICPLLFSLENIFTLTTSDAKKDSKG